MRDVGFIVRLGPFELLRPLAKGGMGAVWRGRHVLSDTPVAVKVINVEHAQNPTWIACFAAEVRAMATMQHPHVVMVFDHGRISPVAADASEGRLLAGSPYVVMELLDGTLSPWAGRLTWASLKRLLLETLAGLAHGHARGIVHRDIKPSNLLVRGRRIDALHLKLTDFGIAHTSDSEMRAGFDEAPSGTPEFAAPEQLAGRFRDYGPWTDLYAVGVVAMRLAFGTAPAPDASAMPDGFASWLCRMLQPNFRRRFAFAADAAHALCAIEMDDSAISVRSATGVDVDTRVPRAHTTQTTRLWSAVSSESATMLLPDAPMPLTDAQGVDPCMVVVPPIAAIPPQSSLDGEALLSAGIGLYGLRPPPLVGRAEPQRVLWRALAQVHETGRARFVELSGGTGCGKSRLAEWIAFVAHETGTAAPVRMVHTPCGGATDGIGPMLGRLLRLDGLDGASAVAHVGRRIDDAEDVLDLVAFARPGAGMPIAFGNARERHALTARCLRALHPDRPLVIVLDDAQWGLDAIGFANCIAEMESFPALVVLNVRSEALAERPFEAAELEALRRRADDRLVRCELDPLDADQRVDLVRRLLGLDGVLALQIAEKCGGSPLFAVELVRDWISRGVLEPGPNGFVLAPGATVDVPDSLATAWRERLERVVADWRDDEIYALELAATLGHDCVAEEWEMACRREGVPVPWARVEKLFGLQLAVAGRGSILFSWVHAMFREAWLDRAVRHGRAHAHHRTCAAVLDPANSARIATHLVAAEAWSEALGAVIGAQEAIRHEGSAQSLYWLDVWDRVLTTMGVPDASNERITWLLSKALAASARGDRTLEAQWFERAAALARGCDLLPDVRAHLETAHAWLLHLGGRLDDAVAALTAAASLPGTAPITQARACQQLSWSLLVAGRTDEAMTAAERAITLFRVAGKSSHQAEIGRLNVLRVSGDAEQSEACARQLLEQRLPGALRAHVLNGLGEVHRSRGDLEAAVLWYGRAKDERVRAQTPSTIEDLNIGSIRTRQGRYTEARALIESVARSERAASIFRGIALLFLVPIDAIDGDRAAWHEHFEQAMAAIGQYRSDDAAEMLELAAAHAGARGWTAEVRQALATAIVYWDELQRPDDAARARFTLAGWATTGTRIPGP